MACDFKFSKQTPPSETPSLSPISSHSLCTAEDEEGPPASHLCRVHPFCPKNRWHGMNLVLPELMKEIFSFLRASDLKRVCWVCTDWMHWITNDRYLKTVIELHGVFAVGGWDGKTELQTAEFYSPFVNKWAAIPPMQEKKSHVGCAVIDRKIYVVGGRDDNKRHRTMEMYDPFVGEWQFLPPMAHQRSSLACKAVGNRLYAFGGFNGIGEQSTNEVFDVTTQRWSFIAPLSSGRSQMASAVLDNYIYLLGGCDMQGKRILNTAQRYNVLSNTFETLPPMELHRLSAAATVLDGLIYVLGGSSKQQQTHPTVECFDPRCNTWTRAIDLSLMRVNLGAITFDDTMFVVGGFHINMDQLSNVERFYPSTHAKYPEVVASCDTAVLAKSPGIEARPGCSAVQGVWKTCCSLSNKRDAVNVCVFE